MIKQHNRRPERLFIEVLDNLGDKIIFNILGTVDQFTHDDNVSLLQKPLLSSHRYKVDQHTYYKHFINGWKGFVTLSTIRGHEVWINWKEIGNE